MPDYTSPYEDTGGKSTGINAGLPKYVSPLEDEDNSTTILGEAGKGLRAGVQQIRGMGYGLGAIAGKVVESPAITDWAREGLADVEAKTPKPAVGSISDIKDVGDVGKYLSYGVATNLPNMALSIASGGVGGVVGKKIVGKAAEEVVKKAVAGGFAGGAFGASLGMEAGSIAGDQLTEAGDVSPGRAMTGAIPAALLDVVPEWYLAKRLGWIGGKAAVREGSRLLQGAKEFGKQFALEAPTEAAQSVIERASVPGKSISNAEAWDEYINSFVLGGATGGVVGGAGGILTKKATQRETPVQQALKDEPVANDIEQQMAELADENEAIKIAPLPEEAAPVPEQPELPPEQPIPAPVQEPIQEAAPVEPAVLEEPPEEKGRKALEEGLITPEEYKRIYNPTYEIPPEPVIPGAENVEPLKAQEASVFKKGEKYKISFARDFDTKPQTRDLTYVSKDSEGQEMFATNEDRRLSLSQDEIISSARAEEAKVRPPAEVVGFKPTPNFNKQGYGSEAEALAMIKSRKLPLADYNVEQVGKRWMVRAKSDILPPVEEKPGTANIPPETTPKAVGGNPFKKSQVQTPVYHGTDAEFDAFSPDSLGANTMDNATDDAFRALSQIGFWFNSGEIKQSKKSPYSQYKPVYLDLKNPAEYPNIESIAEEIRPYIEKNTTEDSDWGTEVNWKQVIKEWRADTFYDDVDGIIVDDEEFGGKSYVVFSPDQIKILPNPSRPPEVGGQELPAGNPPKPVLPSKSKVAPKAKPVPQSKNPMWPTVREIKKKYGGLRLGSRGDKAKGIIKSGFYADYDKTTAKALMKMYPGILSAKGTLNLDEAASEYGYPDGDTFLTALLDPARGMTLRKTEFIDDAAEQALMRQAEEDYNDAIEQAVANLEAEGIDAGRIQASSESVVADILETLAEEGYSNADEDAAVADLSGFFAERGKAHKILEAKPEVGTLEGLTPEETFALATPELKEKRNPALSKYVPEAKTEELPGIEKEKPQYLTAEKNAYDDALYAHDYKSLREGKLTDKEKNVRRLAYGVKGGDAAAVREVATDMAALMPDPESAILVPIPGHTGETQSSILIANEIARQTGAKVEDVLKRQVGPSQRDQRVAGKRTMQPEEFGMVATKKLDGKNVYFVDNVVSSGATLRAARDAVGGGRGLVYAKSFNKEPKYVQGPAQGGLAPAKVTGLVDNLKKVTGISAAVEVVTAPTQIPDSVHDDMIKNGILSAGGEHNVKGVYDPVTGKIFLFPENIRSEKDAMLVISHEIFHDGWNRLFNSMPGQLGVKYKGKSNGILDDIWANHEAEIRDDVGVTHAHLDLSTKTDQRQAANEWLANQAYESQPKWYDKIVTMLRNFLRDVFGSDLQFSDSEIRMLIADVGKAMRDTSFRGGNPQYMVSAWHGGRELEGGRFDTRFIGTGEGAQAFGWGLYFTDFESIAKDYADKVADKDQYTSNLGEDTKKIPRWMINQFGDPRLPGWNIEKAEAVKQRLKIETLARIGEEKRNLTVEPKNPQPWLVEERINGLTKLAELLKKLDVAALEKTKKNLYQVSIHKGKTPDQYNWLEWDKEPSGKIVDAIRQSILANYSEGNPLRQKLLANIEDQYADTKIFRDSRYWDGQKSVDIFANGYAFIQKADFGGYYYGTMRGGVPNVRGHATTREAALEQADQFTPQKKTAITSGEQLYRGIDYALGSDKQASLFLLRAGIDGIKYPAGSLSGMKTGASNYVVFDPSAITVEQHIQYARGATNQPASWDSPEPSKLDNLIYTMADKHIDMRKVVKAVNAARGQIADALDPSLQETLYAGRTAKQTEDFLDMEFKPLMNAMATMKVTLPEFEKYLHNRHAEEANDYIASIDSTQPDDGSGIATQDARNYLAGLDPSLKAKYASLGRRVDAITRKNAQMLVDYKLESQETIDKWYAAYQSYVPLFREDKENRLGTGAGFSVKGASKGRIGSQRNVVDILANIAQQRERTIVRGEKNKIGIALYGLAKLNPNSDFWKIATPSIKETVDVDTGETVRVPDLSYKERDNVVMSRQLDAKTGKIVERGVEFNSDNQRATRMAQALKNIDMDSLGQILGLSAKATRYIASVNTQYNPIFGVTNFARDFQNALFNLTSTEIAGKQKQVGAYALPALKGIYSDIRNKRSGQPAISPWAQIWEDFQKHGGQTGYQDLFRTSKDRTEAIKREISLLQSGKLLGASVRGGRALMGWLVDYNMAMENAVRVSAYKVGIDSGMSKDRAAAMAKNLTVNFNRKGQIATQAGAMYAFFNASMQGTMRLYETLSGPAGKKIMAGGLLLGAVQAAAMAAAGFDDDDPPEFVRERNIIIPIGGKKYVTIPMPLGLHILPNIGRISSEFAMSGFRSPAKRGVDLFGTVAEAFNPLGSSGVSIQTLAPTPVDPLVALAENKDWTGKPIFRENFSSLAPTPGFTRTKNTASIFSKNLSWALNRLSGGTNYQPGLFSPTPDQIDYLIGQATGGIGRELAKTEQAVTSTIGGEELPPYKIPLVSRFYGSSEGQSNQANKFYDNLKLMNAHEAEIKGRRKNGEPVSDYLQKNPEARYWALTNQVERSVRNLTERKQKLIERNAGKESIVAINNIIAARMQRFNETVGRLKD